MWKRKKLALLFERWMCGHEGKKVQWRWICGHDGKKVQNGSRREVTQYFLNDCNGKSHFMYLFWKKGDWNTQMRHIACSLAAKNTIIKWFTLFGNKSKEQIGILCPDILGYFYPNDQLISFWNMVKTFRFDM